MGGSTRTAWRTFGLFSSVAFAVLMLLLSRFIYIATLTNKFFATTTASTHRQRRIAAPGTDRDGENGRTLLVLVGRSRFAYTLGAGSTLLLRLLLGLYNFTFGNVEE